MKMPRTIIYLSLGILIILIAAAAWNTIRTSGFTVNTGSDAVVKELRELKRYETASFTIEKIIDAGTNYGQLRQMLLGDRILLIAHGEVIAGFDLEHLSEDAARIHGQEINLTLPPPQILITRLDSEKSRVYDRRVGFLSQGEKDLESVARAQAEQSIRDAACQSGILATASENGRNQLTTLLKAIGFTTVSITIPESSC